MFIKALCCGVLLLCSPLLSPSREPPTKSSLYPGWDRVDIKLITGDGGWVADEESPG